MSDTNVKQTTVEQPTRVVSGILIVDKPSGLTSNRVLQRVKRIYRARKAGHTGTLDPLATGMLPVCFGAATRVSGLMLDAHKRYRVTCCFGTATDTGDATGTAIDVREVPVLTLEAIEPAVRAMVGRISQIPPMYSALKHRGRKLYELARSGEQVERSPRQVEIFELEIEALTLPLLTLSVHCSKGTYVRTLVSDLAERLGTVAHVTALRRLAVGPYSASQMVTIDELEQAASEGTPALDSRLFGIDSALRDRPAITVSEADAGALRHGRSIEVLPEYPDMSVRIYDDAGAFVGLGHMASSGALKPDQIFPS